MLEVFRIDERELDLLRLLAGPLDDISDFVELLLANILFVDVEDDVVGLDIGSVGRRSLVN